MEICCEPYRIKPQGRLLIDFLVGINLCPRKGYFKRSGHPLSLWEELPIITLSGVMAGWSQNPFMPSPAFSYTSSGVPISLKIAKKFTFVRDLKTVHLI